MEHAELSKAVLETATVVHGELLGEPNEELRARLAGIEVPQLLHALRVDVETSRRVLTA
jgi:hypothetical protein